MRDLLDARLPRPYWVALAYRDQNESWLYGFLITG